MTQVHIARYWHPLLWLLASCQAPATHSVSDIQDAVMIPDSASTDPLGPDTWSGTQIGPDTQTPAPPADGETTPKDTPTLPTDTDTTDTSEPELPLPSDGGSDVPGPAPDCVDAPVIVLEVVPLDIWAQWLDTAVSVVATDPAGASATSETGQVLIVTLCEAGDYNLHVDAPHHGPFTADFSFDGSTSEDALWLFPLSEDIAHVLTTDLRPYGQLDEVRFFTVWTGLPHHWFAPSGFPATHGAHVTLYAQGEEAWASVAADLWLAEDQVAMTSWWWSSVFELVRDPATHLWLSPEQRWEHTILGRLEDLWDIERRVMVNQFITQDGLFSEVNVDDLLLEKAETPGDQFEYMGIANPVLGSFWATPKAVDFSQRLEGALGEDALNYSWQSVAGLPAFSDPILVDTTDLPLGLGLLNVPIASWHQKMITIDGQIAYVGGMNVTETDWDSSEHQVYEARRMDFDASTGDREAVAAKSALPTYAPARDYMIRLEGPIATDVESVFAELWQFQLDKEVLYADLSTPAMTHPLADPAPDGPNTVQAQLLFTVPDPYGEYSVLESLTRAIGRAESYIFIEDQYLRSEILSEHLVARMSVVPELQLIVISNPIDEWTDLGCWQTHLEYETLSTLFPKRFTTYRLMAYDAVDTGCFLCIDEVLATFTPFHLHSKLVIIDDVYLEVGSANHNNRSMLYDAELAVAVFDATWVKQARETLTKDLLGAYFIPGLSAADTWSQMSAVANLNQAIYDAWDSEGFDLDLDGDPVPNYLIPEAPIYPLSFGTPDDCLLEGIGPDISRSPDLQPAPPVSNSPTLS